jgi:integrase
VSTFRPDQWVKLTKTSVDKIEPPTSGQRFVRDGELKGFALRITASGTKSFVIEKRIDGRVRRITLGRYGELTVEQARKRAHQTLGKIAMGIDPLAEQKQERARSITLRTAFHDFKTARQTLIKPKTLYDYDRYMKTAFADWQRKPVIQLTKAMVANYHRHLGQSRGENYANGAMRFLRALLNVAQATYDDGNGHSLLLENPVNVLTQTRSWYHTERRRTVIKVHQLPRWYQAVMALKASDQPEMAATVADYLVLLLFTGLRRQEAAQLQWQHVDFLDRTLTIPDTKNREPHSLPLSDALYDLLKVREVEAVNEFVFPGKEGQGYLIEPKRHIQKVIEHSGVEFIIHDLRRTFITIAEAIDIAPYTIKRLVNHKINGDVTAGYIISDMERLRGPMQKVTDFITNALDLNETQRIVTFPAQGRN